MPTETFTAKYCCWWQHPRVDLSARWADRDLTSPWAVQSVTCPVRELTSLRVGNPLGISVSCPVTVPHSMTVHDFNCMQQVSTFDDNSTDMFTNRKMISNSDAIAEYLGYCASNIGRLITTRKLFTKWRTINGTIFALFANEEYPLSGNFFIRTICWSIGEWICKQQQKTTKHCNSG